MSIRTHTNRTVFNHQATAKKSTAGFLVPRSQYKKFITDTACQARTNLNSLGQGLNCGKIDMLIFVSETYTKIESA